SFSFALRSTSGIEGFAPMIVIRYIMCRRYNYRASTRFCQPTLSHLWRRRGMKRILAVLAVSAAALLTLPGVATAQTIKIGAVLSLTGGASFIGEDQRLTLEMMTDQLNAAGGINGRKVETIIYDDASDPTKAVAALRRLH